MSAVDQQWPSALMSDRALGEGCTARPPTNGARTVGVTTCAPVGVTASFCTPARRWLAQLGAGVLPATVAALLVHYPRPGAWARIPARIARWDRPIVLPSY